MHNNPKGISEALKEYCDLKDSGNVEALNAWNELYNKPKSGAEFVGPEAVKRQLNEYPSHYPDPLKYPNHYPKKDSTVAQDYYNHGQDKDESEVESDDPWDGSYFPSNDLQDFYGDELLY